jgi:hypothetical protein
VELVDSSGYQYYWYTWDGWFDGYLNPGTYQATITEWSHNQGHQQVMFTLNVNQGEQNDALNYILEETQIPIPELAAVPLPNDRGSCSILFRAQKATVTPT